MGKVAQSSGHLLYDGCRLSVAAQHYHERCHDVRINTATCISSMLKSGSLSLLQ
jgi:hypothetical protein